MASDSSESTRMASDSESADGLSSTDGYNSDSASSLGADAEEKDAPADADVIEFARSDIDPTCLCLSHPQERGVRARAAVQVYCLGLCAAETWPLWSRVGTLEWTQWLTAIYSGLRKKLSTPRCQASGRSTKSKCTNHHQNPPEISAAS